MDNLLSNVKAWFASKGGFSHVAVAVFVAIIAAFNTVPEFHKLCMDIYNTLPGWAEELVGAALALYAWYRSPLSPAGTMAAARSVSGLPNAPTAKEIDAAIGK